MCKNPKCMIKRSTTLGFQQGHFWMVLILILLLFNVLVSCNRDKFTVPPVAQWRVSGLVIDSIDGSPIPLARVSVGDSLTSSNGFFTSDSSGAYVAFLFDPGVQMLLSRKSGYLTKAITVEIGVEEFIKDNVIFEMARE